MLTANDMDIVEIRLLRYAIASAEHRSFRRAAEVLRIKQSTLSRRIRQLELRLGVELFSRSRTGVLPTEIAAPFLRTAAELVKLAASMTESIRAAERGERGHLRLGVCVSPCARDLRRILLSFGKAFPDVEIKIVESPDADLRRGLEMGILDVVIVSEDGPGLSPCSLALWSERILVALPERHPLAERDGVSWGDLVGETLLTVDGYRSESGGEKMALGKPGDGAETLRQRRHAVPREHLIPLVACGMGLAVIPEGLAGTGCSGVVYRKILNLNGATRLGYMAEWRVGNPNPVLKKFLGVLIQHYPPVDSIMG